MSFTLFLVPPHNNNKKGWVMMRFCVFFFSVCLSFSFTGLRVAPFTILHPSKTANNTNKKETNKKTKKISQFHAFGALIAGVKKSGISFLP